MLKRRKEKAKSPLDLMRAGIERAQKVSNKHLRFKPGEKRRVRFLTELVDATTIDIHQVWKGFFFPCPGYFGYDCPFCSNDHEYGKELRTTQKFAISLFDYETKEVKFILEASNNFSPIASMLDYQDEFGTITDRDYIVKKTGEALNSNFTIMEGKQNPFAGRHKFKALTEDEIFDHLWSINQKAIEEELGVLEEEGDDEFGEDGEYSNEDNVENPQDEFKEEEEIEEKADDGFEEEEEEPEELEPPKSQRSASKFISKRKKPLKSNTSSIGTESTNRRRRRG